jgi:hypothetical protein
MSTSSLSAERSVTGRDESFMKTGVAGARPLLERGPLKGSAFRSLRPVRSAEQRPGADDMGGRFIQLPH